MARPGSADGTWETTGMPSPLAVGIDRGAESFRVEDEALGLRYAAMSGTCRVEQ